MTDEQSEKEARYARSLSNAFTYVAKEPFILASMEEFFFPKPARLDDKLQQDVDDVIRQLGGPPDVIITREEEPKPKYDVYPAAAMHELVSLFDRSRGAVTRAQAILVGSQLVKNSEKELITDLPTGAAEALLDYIDSIFWEHAETGFIRLASYWDRMGQLFDFVFFGIRQFDKDGFSAVMDRIRNNLVPVDNCLAQLPGWVSLRQFQTSEKEDGLKWLLRRRNLVVHSLYLRPLHEAEDIELFDSEFNHLDVALREKLTPGSPSQEVNRWLF
jgi:hypothetical protein